MRLEDYMKFGTEVADLPPDSSESVLLGVATRGVLEGVDPQRIVSTMATFAAWGLSLDEFLSNHGEAIDAVRVGDSVKVGNRIGRLVRLAEGDLVALVPGRAKLLEQKCEIAIDSTLPEG